MAPGGLRWTLLAVAMVFVAPCGLFGQSPVVIEAPVAPVPGAPQAPGPALRPSPAPPAGPYPQAPSVEQPGPQEPVSSQPLAPQAPGAPAYGQKPMEYAFRPDLTNPEYGQCLQMEKHWKSLYERYYNLYQQAMTMNRADPRFTQLSQYMAYLRPQLDRAWNDFSSKCVYFPRLGPPPGSREGR